MSWLGIEPGPPAREASTLENSHLENYFSGYSELLLGMRLASHPDLYSTKKIECFVPQLSKKRRKSNLDY
jgi:hypothetical protein